MIPSEEHIAGGRNLRLLPTQYMAPTAGIPLNSCDEDSRPPAIMTLTWVNALMAGNAQLST